MSDWISYISLVISIGAASLALFRVGIADEANYLASSAPWVSVILKHVEEEIKNAQQEMDLFVSFFSVPFKDVPSKKEALQRLGNLREESAQRQYILRALVPTSALLISQRALLENIDHDFMYNEELAPQPKEADLVLERYRKQVEHYFGVIREFGVSVSIHRSATLGVDTRFMRIQKRFVDFLKESDHD